jgi:hypothetical protein
MARVFGQALAGGRGILSMECALVCLLVTLSILGDSLDLDRKVRMAATGLIASVYESELLFARAPAVPVNVRVRIQAQAVPAR